ncbi:MAG: glycoside hydrolase family 3 N-terminal domain-containing protein, partial [Thermoanaerobaculia bacterium]
EQVQQFIAQHKVGGVFLNRENCNVINGPSYDPSHCGFPSAESLDTPAQLAVLAQGLQETACQATQGLVEGTDYCLPLFIAVDHEGDDRPVTRLLNGFTPLPSNMAIGATFDSERAEAVGCIAGQELAAVGINMLFGPDLDVLDSPRSGGPGDQGIRVFGGHPLWVAEMGSAYVQGVQECGKGRLATVAKHFPGHGSSTRRVDYEDIPVLAGKTLEELGQVDLAPFAAVASGAPGESGVTDGIMNSHLSYPEVEGCDGRTPVTFSPSCMQAFLGLPDLAAWRQKGGVTVVDDLASGAVQAYARAKFGAYQQGTIALEALMAGNDVLPLIRPWQWEALGPTVDFLVDRYEADEQARSRVDDAVRRVLALKQRLYPNLEPNVVTAATEHNDVVGQAASASKMASLAAAALTFIRPASLEEFLATVPAPAVDERVLFIECWDDPTCAPPSPSDASGYPALWPQGKLATLALEMFPGRILPDKVKTIGFSELGAVLEGTGGGEVRNAVEEADWLVFALLERDPGRFPDSEVLKDFLGRGPAQFDLRSKKLVVFAFNSPYHLDAGELQKVDLFVAAYSKIEPSLRASLKTLFQDQTIFRDMGGQGSLPVDYIFGAYILYDLNQQVEADPAQRIELAVEPEEPGLGEEFTVTLVKPLLARNGHEVPNGTAVQFTFELPDGAIEQAAAVTRDGLVQASIASPQPGDVLITIASGELEWSQSQTVGTQGTGPVDGDTLSEGAGGGGGGGFPVVLVVAAAGGGPLAAGAVAAGLYLLWRRRGQMRPVLEAPSSDSGVEEAAPKAQAGAQEELLVEADTHRVFLRGIEVVPPLSREQYDLLAYLHQNRGKLCVREEIIRRVWPEVEATGVSEEALDALVHRLRERLQTAGASRPLIVTVRGQGFRLDI